MTKAPVEWKLQEGIYTPEEVPEETYHSLRAPSSSTLKLMKKSPYHCRKALDEPQGATPAMIFGSCFHAYILEPDDFNGRYTPKETFSGKGAKERREDWQALVEKDGLQVVPATGANSWEHLVPMKNAIDKGSAATYLSNIKAEQTVFWRPDGQTMCRSRLDGVDFQNRFIVDLKTCTDATYESCQRQIANFGYHISAAFYVDAIKSQRGQEFSFWFIFVEKQWPYAVTIWKLEEAALCAGRDLYLRYLTRYRECVKSNHWPSQEGRGIDLPSWEYSRIDKEVEIDV